MDAREEIKKTILTEPIKLALKWLPAGLLLIVLYIPVVYRWVAAKLPFWLLLMIASIEFLLLVLAGSYITHLRKKRKELTPTLIHRFGIQWDKDQNPHCPKCSNRLGRYTKYLTEGWGFECLHCDRVITMGTDDGKQLELAEARALLVEDNTNQAISATQQQLKQDDKTKSLSVESEKILVYLSRVPSRDATREGLIEQLKIDPTLLIYSLHELLKDRYIGVSREGTMLETFGLMQKGRKYLIDNQLLKSSRR
jgi:hypothetical protein